MTLQEQIEAALSEVAAVAARQHEERSAAERLVSRGTKILDRLDAERSPTLIRLAALYDEQRERRARTLDPWVISHGRAWESGHRCIAGRSEWSDSIAWLRVGTWSEPRWYLDVRGSGQHDLGPPNDNDPEDAARRRAAADEILIKAGYILAEREGQ